MAVLPTKTISTTASAAVVEETSTFLACVVTDGVGGNIAMNTTTNPILASIHLKNTNAMMVSLGSSGNYFALITLLALEIRTLSHRQIIRCPILR